MKFFNAFQVTAAFVAWPFLISYLHGAEFRGADVAFYASCAIYVVAFYFMVCCVYKLIDEE